MILEQDVFSPGLNFFSRERLDPFAVKFLHLLGLPEYGQGYTAFQLLILFLGILWLFTALRCRRIEAVFAAFLAVLGVAFVSAFDPLFMKMHWFPALLAGHYLLGTRRSIPGLFLLLCIIWVYSAGTLAIFGALLCLAATVLLPEPESSTPEARSAHPLQVVSRGERLGSYILLFTAGAAFMPVFAMPDYPADGRLVPISPLLFYESPLIGDSLQPNPLLDEMFIRVLRILSIRFAAVSGCILVVLFIAGRGNAAGRRQAFAAAAILICTFLVSGAEWFTGLDFGRVNLPFPVISRLVPGMAVSNLPWLLMPFGIIISLSLIVRTFSLPGLVILGCLFFACLQLPRIGIFKVPEEVHSQVIGPATPEEKILYSPSWYLIHRLGEWVIKPRMEKKREDSALRRLVPGTDFQFELDAFPRSEDARLALDGKYETRWKTGRPQQAGDYFLVKFRAPVRLVRAVLSTRTSPSDFPRGLQVTLTGLGGKTSDVINQPDWLGPVLWTPKGYPYFGAQSDVILDFPEEGEVQAIRVTLIGKGDAFDWSINEIKFYEEKR